MGSNWTGWNLGGEPAHGFRERSPFVGACLCFVFLGGVASAQICPSGTCTVPNAETDCDDGLFCTLALCIGSTCACPARTCDDSLFCTQDNCNETTNACEHTPTNCQAPNPQCSETLDACVECLNNGHCTTPPRLRCNSSGVCVQCTNSAECQDSSFCNGFESCNLSTGLCEAGTPVACQKTCFMGSTPGANCTTDANCGSGGRCLGYCNDTQAQCVQCKVEGDCDDGKFCNGAETCDQNDQCVVGTPPVCKKCVGGSQQGQPCSTAADCPGSPTPGTCTGGPSYCDGVSNQCVACLNPSHCEDLNFCTTNACIFNACVFSPDPAICSDGVFCNGEEVCTWAVGNDCSIFSDRPHCCSAGPPVNCADGFSCTVDSCNETTNACQNITNNSLCPGTNLACNGTETCQPGAPGADPASGCVAGTPMDCSSFDTDCSLGTCAEAPLPAHCVGQAINQGAACNDNNVCTAISKCNNGSCVDNPPAANDPYRCVRLEWRAFGPTTVHVGQTVSLRLYAVASGCNTLHDSNMRCVGGAAAGNICTTNANCRVCVGGTNAGMECISDAFCSGGGGTCPAGGTCIDFCPSSAMPVSSIDAIVNWNKTFLQLNPSTGPNPNPQDSCVQPTACTSCPPDTYNWVGTGGFSGWINDCTGDGLNQPCSTAVPANDGNARYLALQGVNQSCSSACATTAGLLVSSVIFQAISGGISQIALLPCFGTSSKTQAQTTIINESVQTTDITKSLGPGITITVQCDGHDDCNDNNNCTNDTCTCTTPLCGGTCQHANNTNTCNDGLFCTTNDRCSGGQCIGDATTCKKCVGGPDAGAPCYTSGQCGAPGTCTGAASICQETNDRCVECSSAANCNDGLGSTTDACVKTCSGGNNLNGVCEIAADCPGVGGVCETDYCENTPIDCNDNVACTVDVSDPVDGHCTNTPDHAFCNPLNSFCSAARCDPLIGCVLDHECISNDGNPCPNPATCSEGTRMCGGCIQPTLTAAGPRYLKVTPGDQGSTPVALLVTGDCANPAAACVSRYVQSKCNGGSNNGSFCISDADCPKRCVGGQFPNAACTVPTDCPQGECVGRCDAGTLGPTPVYKTAAQWGTAQVRGAHIRPETRYMVHAECNFPGGAVLSSAASAETWLWGDVDDSGVVNALDVANLVNAFKGFFGPYTFEQMNLWACDPDIVLNALDIAVDVDAVRGFAFPCGITCP